ncbi:HlyD family efflux transporter periplasmic adaptor subunit [Hymenobacter sp. YC55]|uniref:HlyD family efflux transporter periplasmic adaptor subunit n=1 Tax=Hymenobacter sp. YC55 TaxID=3034019 RepID=UPI0023F9A2D9|nr:HlyD family efflux transporter periplasmic adaptor subunit [Hymenobacter sp. YC55]MDF7815889.1 efflux RND transporter periplasmic adaptor subunit [Hymenobacter sp. YC55]
MVSPLSGYVKQVYFQDGQAVQAGQILVKLDADSQLAARQLTRGFIFSPAAGIITARRVEVGRPVHQRQSVAMLQDWSAVHLAVPLSLAQAQALNDHDTLAVYVAELPTQRFRGSVVQVASVASHPTLLMRIPNHGRVLITPQMHAFVKLPARPLISKN